MKLPKWTWRWTWAALMRWSRLSIDTELTGSERWWTALVVIRAGVRGYYLDPVRRWSLAKSPAWLVKARLERAGHGWYRVRTRAAAEHCRLRFDVSPIDVGDMLRVRRGKVSHVGYCGPRHTEILEFLPNGDLRPAPDIPGMRRAWAAFSAASRASTSRALEDRPAAGE